MINIVKSHLYSLRCELLIKQGIAKGLIVPFDEEIYNKLDNIFYDGIPVSLYLKYLGDINEDDGKCFLRSTLLTMGIDNSLLVRGNHKDLELKYGDAYSNHGWVEKDNYVYDPSYLLRFNKDLYYSIFEVSNLEYYNYSDYNNDWYQDIINTSLYDICHDRKYRYILCEVVPIIQEKAIKGNNYDLIEKLNNYLSIIQYDYYNIALNKEIIK